MGSQGITGVVEEGSGRFRKARDSAFTHSLPPREVELFVFNESKREEEACSAWRGLS